MFSRKKKGIFSDKKKSDIFQISAQNIDCGYSLEPPRRGGSNEYPQSMFFSEIRKIMYTPVNPSFTIKVGFKVVKIVKACFRDVRTPAHSRSLTRIFTRDILDSQECKYSACGQWRLGSDCANGQADLSPLGPYERRQIFSRYGSNTSQMKETHHLS